MLTFNINALLAGRAGNSTLMRSGSSTVERASSVSSVSSRCANYVTRWNILATQNSSQGVVEPNELSTME